jgi:hypothetical protein
MYVSTGRGSDRVSIQATVESAETITRSLPLPVLTSSLNLTHEGRASVFDLGNKRTRLVV